MEAAHMRQTAGFWVSMGIALSLLAPVALAQDGPSEADKQKLQSYTLTMDKLQQFSAADQALYGDAAKDPALKSELEHMSDEEPEDTIADLTAKLVRHPKVAAYYNKQGLSNEEAVLIPLVTVTAMGEARGAPAGEAAPAQVEFVKQHEKEVEAMLEEWSKEEND